MKISKIFQAVICGLLLCLMINPVFAVEASDTTGPTLEVNELSDLPDTDLEDNQCRTTEGGCSLRAAIMESNADTDRIRLIQILQAGTISTSSNEITSSVVIVGFPLSAQGEIQTTLAGNGSSRIFNIFRNNTEPVEVLIQNVVLQDGPNLQSGSLGSNNGSIIFNRGNLKLDTVTVQNGGKESNAVFNEGLDLEVVNSRFFGNGRGIATDGGRVFIDKSRFEGNQSRAGGALFSDAGFVFVTDSDFVSNSSDAKSNGNGKGGAIQQLGGVLTIESSRFNNNQGLEGGAIYSTGTLVIKGDTVFAANRAERGQQVAPSVEGISDGGAILIADGSAFIRDARFSQNEATRRGGAIHVASSATAQLLRLSISENLAGFAGGGVSFETTSNGSFLSGSEVRANIVTSEGSGGGGGIALAGGATIRNCIVSENTAIRGGGIAASGDANIIENSTIVHNQAFTTNNVSDQIYGPAGGILMESTDSDHKLTLTHVTVAANASADETASGLAGKTGTIVLNNSIVLVPADNTVLCSGSIESAGNNISGDASCNLTGSGDKANQSSETLPNPNDNGGPTQTIALPSGSQAIDLVPGSDCLDTDQRFFPRDINDRCDAGAFETGAVQPISGQLNFRTRAFPRNESDGELLLFVEREGGRQGAVTVQVVDLLAGDAASGIDYEFETQTLSWADGDDAPKPFTIKLIDDTNKETDFAEEVVLALLNPTGAARIGERDVATVEILEDDSIAYGEFRLNSQEFLVSEVIRDDAPGTNDDGEVVQKAGSVAIEIQRTGPADSGATFRYKTIDGTAIADEDYTPVDTLVTFLEDESSKVILINMLDDDEEEEDETFFFEISNDPSVAPVFFSKPTRATITIDSEDITPVDPGPAVRDRTRNATGALNPLFLVLLFALMGLKNRIHRRNVSRH